MKFIFFWLSILFFFWAWINPHFQLSLIFFGVINLICFISLLIKEQQQNIINYYYFLKYKNYE